MQIENLGNCSDSEADHKTNIKVKRKLRFEPNAAKNVPPDQSDMYEDTNEKSHTSLS